tara:strand:- start:795 stop:1238 length:444 start_codon:yes stop_codon:yes gene_type:complete
MCERILILVLLFVLGGCATTQYGNYVQNDSSAHNNVMASDAAYQLLQHYPPASTRFELQHVVEDSFGVAFLEYLRGGGYAVQEHQPSKFATMDTTETDNKGIALAYILDEASGIYRLSLTVDKQRLTRAYTPDNGKVLPAGHWLRME